MKHFSARPFSMHPLALIAGVCLIVITIPSARWIDAERANVGAVPREIAATRGAVVAEVDKQAGILTAQLSRLVDGDPNAAAPIDRAPLRRLVIAEVDAQLTGARGDLRGALGALQTSANGQLTAALGLADRRIGDSLARVDTALGAVEGLRSDLRPVFIDADLTLKGTTALVSTYQGLPDRLSAELRPSWLSIQPEITCRQLNGSGYGGCMRGRINGLLGEAVNVGGVFTKRFPEFSASITGIAGDVHTFTARAVAPRGFWGNVKDVLSTGSGVARAGAACRALRSAGCASGRDCRDQVAVEAPAYRSAGEIARAAYLKSLGITPSGSLPAEILNAWEAAAKAVIVAVKEAAGKAITGIQL